MYFDTPPPLVSDDMDLFTLLLRLRVRLASDDPATLTWVLPELLVRCQSDVDDPEGTFDAVARLARPEPEAGRRALLDALERGVDGTLRAALVGLFAELGGDLAEREADALRRLGAERAGERVHAMYLLCALGPTTAHACRAALEADLGRLWRLEQLRVEALARGGEVALTACVEALRHAEEAVRARAEAALAAMGPAAVAAVPALLAMPAWVEGNDRPSPALFAVGDAVLFPLREALDDPSPIVAARARAALDSLEK